MSSITELHQRVVSRLMKFSDTGCNVTIKVTKYVPVHDNFLSISIARYGFPNFLNGKSKAYM